MLKIGYKVKLKRAMLGCDEGDIGYVFDEYPDFDLWETGETGVQVVLKNGNFDGFSANEQELYLEFLEQDSEYLFYEFKNVLQVSRDFLSGYWKFN